MNILAIHQSSELYGSDRSFFSAIMALKESGKNITVILPNDGDLSSLLKAQNINVIYRKDGYLRKSLLKNPINFLIKSFKEFFWLLKKYKSYDLIYVNTIVCFSAILALIFSNKRKIIHVREIPTGFIKIIFVILLKISRSKLIYNSNATKEEFGINGVVIYNGVNPTSSSENIKQTTDLVKILIVGRINSWKGHGFFLKSLTKSNNKFHIKIVGDTVQGQDFLIDDLKKIVKSELMNKGHIIEFCGFDNDVSKFYKWCNYLVVPSIKPEPFGRVAIEALSYGKPVIASKCGGLVEIVDNKLNGFLFEPNSSTSLNNVLDKLPLPNTDIYIEMSKNSLTKYLENFSEDSYKKNIILEVK